jgi:hypothetical protein
MQSNFSNIKDNKTIHKQASLYKSCIQSIFLINKKNKRANLQLPQAQHK